MLSNIITIYKCYLLKISDINKITVGYILKVTAKYRP